MAVIACIKTIKNIKETEVNNSSILRNLVAGLIKTILPSAFMTLALALTAGTSFAQTPGKPITIIVPTTPGTGSDIAARLFAPRLSKNLGVPVIVENRTGASGIIGINYVAKAAPDGNTILFVPNTMAMISSLEKNVPFDVVADFAPVARIGKMLVCTVVNPSVPAQTIGQLIALSKKEPGQLNYGSPGSGTPHHLRTEMFKQITGADITHVPYKTSAGAVTDLLGGHVQVGFFPLHSVLPMVKAGKLRMLATSGETRSHWTPDVPTYRESGIQGLNDYDWVGAFLPRKTPPEIVSRFSRELLAIVNSPDVQADLEEHGIIANPGGPDELATLLKNELVEWKKVIEQAHIVAQ
jgi:tripartite-type tricarboxylate transporter receptor subunit TctC